MGNKKRIVSKSIAVSLIMALSLGLGVSTAPDTPHQAMAKVNWYKIKGKWVGFDKAKAKITWSDGLNYIPKKIAGKKVKIIGKSAFCNNKNLKVANIPSSVKTIERYAFGGCPNLKKVVFPKGFKMKNGYVREKLIFWDSNNLKTVVNNPDKTWAKEMQTFKDTLTYLSKQDPQYYVEHVREAKNQWVPDDEGNGHHKYTDKEWAVVENQAKMLTEGWKTDMDKAKAISRWIVGHLHYNTSWMEKFQEWRKTHDEDKEVFPIKKYTDAYNLITWKASEHDGETATTTCGGYGNLTQALFACAGIPCIHVHREQKKGEKIDHVFNVAYVDGKWIWIDNTYSEKDDPLGYFNCQIAGMSASDHRCDRLNLENLTDLMSGSNNTLSAAAYTEGETEYVVGPDGLRWGINRKKNQIDYFPRDFVGPEIPAEIDGMKVTSIGEYACSSRRTLTEITIPAGVKTIGDGAFQNCDSLETVNYLGGRKNVKHGCFVFRGSYFLHPDFSSAYKKGIFYKQLHDVRYSGNLVTDALNIGVSQLNYHQGNNEKEMHGYNKKGGEYYTEYNYYSGLPDWQWGMKDLVKESQYKYGYGGWCGNFCDWCLNMAGIPRECLGYTGDLDEIKWSDTVYAGGSYEIQPGDVLHFSAGHYALVHSVKVDGNKVKVKTLNGNPSVDWNTYPLNSKDGKNDKNHNYDLVEILPTDLSKLSSVKSFTVRFDADGGTTPIDTKKVYEGASYGLLPKPRRQGYTFDGWYTEKNGGGKKITAYRNVYPNGDFTAYANWKEGAEPAYLDYDSYVSKAPSHSTISDRFARVYLTKTSFSYKDVKKKAQKTTIKKKNGKGKMHFTNTTEGAKKKYIKISKTGVVTIKKGAPKGTYSIHVKVDQYKQVNMTQSTVYITIK